MSGNHPLQYAFAQAFGEKGADGTAVAPVQEADMISAVRFSDSAQMVATGDKGGRIVILRRVEEDPADDDDAEDGGDPKSSESSEEGRRRRDEARSRPSPPNFTFWTQFQSHEPEFDYLKSMEIEEKVNQIRWCRQVNDDQRLIATNDKTIKIWRVFEKEVTSVTKLLAPTSPRSPSSAAGVHMSAALDAGVANGHAPAERTRWPPPRPKPPPNGFGPASSDSNFTSTEKKRRPYTMPLPRLEHRGKIVRASPRRVFSGAHAYHINSISLNSDEETFMSADDLRVNMWNLNVGGTGFNILDIKPENMEDLTEVITAAQFHPTHCHLFTHSSSRGVVKVCDLRQSALCQTWVKQYEAQDNASSRNSFFSEIIASISDVQFSPDGRYILTRDYMNLRLWDMQMERAPVLVIPVHEHLRSRLCDMYENDCIFDKFQCVFSHDGGSLLTGSYNSLFQSYSAADGAGAAVEASVDFVSGVSGRHTFTPEGLTANLLAGASASELVDPSRRILHLDASPMSNVAAVAAGPALYLYDGDHHTLG